MDVSLSVFSVSLVQFPVTAEYFKGFSPGWSHVRHRTQFKEDQRLEPQLKHWLKEDWHPLKKAFNVMIIMKWNNQVYREN